EYRLTTRGAKGVKTINITEKTGQLVNVRAVNGDEDAMIVTNEGIIIRISLENVGIYGRNTQGVRLINVTEGQLVAKVAIVDKEDEAEEINESVIENENIVEVVNIDNKTEA
ncbi:MAG: DNA gyrase C-terminal beta-propeller domain-containing protein, partial [Erysipelotrichaceae bacterium]